MEAINHGAMQGQMAVTGLRGYPIGIGSQTTASATCGTDTVG
ncbi:hypothetical protein [Microbulbifer spongiae]|nr:hypothetical protein [Microbulbifer sp. MI-G]